MTQDNDLSGPPRRPQSRLLAKEITALGLAIDEIHQELGLAGEVSGQTRSQLQSQLATVIFQIRQWRDESQVEWQQATPWDGGPDALLQMMLDGSEQMVPQKGRHGATPQKRQTSARIAVDELYDAATDIMDICNDLGLAPEIDDGSGSIIAEPIGDKSDELPPPMPAEDDDDEPAGPQ